MQQLLAIFVVNGIFDVVECIELLANNSAVAGFISSYVC